MGNERMSGGAYRFARMEGLERRAVTAEEQNGVMLPLDDRRAAQLGALAELPSMGEVLAAWIDRWTTDGCEDYPVQFNDLLLGDDGRLLPTRYSMGEPGDKLTGVAQAMPMTYRVFGGLIRQHCAPPRNVARCLIELPIATTPWGHTARTARRPDEGIDGVQAPRAAAYNAYLDRKKRYEAAAARAGAESTTVILRTRLMHAKDEDGGTMFGPRTVIGAVSPTHCLRDGDDDKLIAALTLAFAGSMDVARATAYRGVDESELRAVFPALEVRIPSAGSERWFGYVTARNSESGAKSWSVSAGLYRPDGASVAVEAIVRTGRHVGHHVAERMVEVAHGAAELLQQLVAEAGARAGRAAPWEHEETLRRLARALKGTAAGSDDVLCGIAYELGRATAQFDEPITVGLLMNVLGLVSANVERRVDARPIEVMLGRMLLDGWTELRAVGTEANDDGSEEE